MLTSPMRQRAIEKEGDSKEIRERKHTKSQVLYEKTPWGDATQTSTHHKELMTVRSTDT